MIGFIIIISLILLGIIILQIARINELTRGIRGEEASYFAINDRQGKFLLLFLFAFLLATIASSFYYKNYMLGYGPHQSASEHGYALDSLFNTTLFFTGIVFVLTHIALFWFSYKYRQTRTSKATHISHNNKLEIIWTVIPSIVLVFLVVNGLIVWNDVMADVTPEEDFIEFEAMGYQFAWAIRYPGDDGALGHRDFQLINGLNPFGQDWSDYKNLDDFHPSEIVLPVDKKVRVRITARDVLHNFYLPHFRVKMDAVPGIPTYFVFTPTTTTAEYRQQLREYPEYNVPSDPEDPTSPMKWEDFNYELACAELCGRGHYSMRTLVRIVTQEEYDRWLEDQNSYYFSSIRGSNEDPYADDAFGFELEEKRLKFLGKFEEAVESDSIQDQTLVLEDVVFELNSTNIEERGFYELDILSEVLEENPNVRIGIRAYPDAEGIAADLDRLQRERAETIGDYLGMKGIADDRIVLREDMYIQQGQQESVAPPADGEGGRVEIIIL